MTIEKIPAARLNPAAYNPRKDLKPGDREYEKLKRSIAEFGYVEPVIWNRQTGNVVGGHQRLKVLVDMGQTEIDCVVVDLDLRREKALNIALNKIIPFASSVTIELVAIAAAQPKVSNLISSITSVSGLILR